MMGEEETRHFRLPDVVIADALAGVLDDLASLPATPRTRELQARADNYRRALEGWKHVKPNPAQRLALRDLVADLANQVDEVRNEVDMAQTPVVGVPVMRTPSAPPSRKR
jgi:hypothetical protein